MGFDLVYKTRHQFLPVEQASSPIKRMVTEDTACLAGWYYSMQGPTQNETKNVYLSPPSREFPCQFKLNFFIPYNQSECCLRQCSLNQLVMKGGHPPAVAMPALLWILCDPHTPFSITLEKVSLYLHWGFNNSYLLGVTLFTHVGKLRSASCFENYLWIWEFL